MWKRTVYTHHQFEARKFRCPHRHKYHISGIVISAGSGSYGVCCRCRVLRSTASVCALALSAPAAFCMDSVLPPALVLRLLTRARLSGPSIYCMPYLPSLTSRLTSHLRCTRLPQRGLVFSVHESSLYNAASANLAGRLAWGNSSALSPIKQFTNCVISITPANFIGRSVSYSRRAECDRC